MYPSTLDADRLLRQTFVAQVQHYQTLSSTNDCAKSLAERPVGELPLLIVAAEQTAGRGQGARRWWTGRGSLAFSLLLDTATITPTRAQWSLIALASGVAVVEAVKPLLPEYEVGLHWPNDVYVEGRKLAGILVEVLSDRRCVIGIGLNTNNSLRDAPEELKASATTLLELTGMPHDPTEILVVLLSALEKLLNQLGSSPEAVAARANDLCLQHGQKLTLQQGNRPVTGRCAGIASDGALVLETSAGVQRVYSGTVQGSQSEGPTNVR